MEFKNFIFQAWKVMEFCLIDQLLQMTIKYNVRQRGVIKQHKRRKFRWTPEFVSVEQFKVKKYAKAGKVFKIFETDN